MRQQILALLASGKPYSQIVAEVGCTKSTVACRAKNVRPAPNYKVHDWAEIQLYHDAGHRVVDCRSKYGICRSVWYNAVRVGKFVARQTLKIPIEVLTSVQNAN